MPIIVCRPKAHRTENSYSVDLPPLGGRCPKRTDGGHNSPLNALSNTDAINVDSFSPLCGMQLSHHIDIRLHVVANINHASCNREG
jgi:hypothetical protein